MGGGMGSVGKTDKPNQKPQRNLRLSQSRPKSLPCQTPRRYLEHTQQLRKWSWKEFALLATHESKAR